jgi:hypothetical protein
MHDGELSATACIQQHVWGIMVRMVSHLSGLMVSFFPFGGALLWLFNMMGQTRSAYWMHQLYMAGNTRMYRVDAGMS